MKYRIIGVVHTAGDESVRRWEVHKFGECVGSFTSRSGRSSHDNDATVSGRV